MSASAVIADAELKRGGRDWRGKRDERELIWFIWSVWFNQTNKRERLDKQARPAGLARMSRAGLGPPSLTLPHIMGEGRVGGR